ncbi:hypothetical protein TrCOL_g2020 [Triparma columacea]|uniref:RRM domain-containing protein n=1 Tax=Triparma columacea TaxID=722753 RepID=A0A9W7GB84_9STRA|nr:hypothetical protein TrCOL_g2020 [Triparma columacea]
MGGVGLIPIDPLTKIPNLTHPDKTNRELFIGNTGPDVTDQLLMQFLNAAMMKVGLALPKFPEVNGGKPIIQVRVAGKFAFAQTRTEVEAANLLNLNNIPFMGNYLKIIRPSKYSGPHTTSVTWQELTGMVDPNAPKPGAPTGASSGDASRTDTRVFAADDKIFREIFIGNTTEDTNEAELMEFLNTTLFSVGLTHDNNPKPVSKCRVNGKFCFVECVTPEDTALALNIDQVPFKDQQLKLQRPSRYPGVITENITWNEVLEKVMAGEMGQGIKPPVPSLDNPSGKPTTASSISEEKAVVVTKIVRLTGMISPKEDLVEDEDYNDVVLDIKQECETFGKLLDIVVPRLAQPGEGDVFLKYDSEEGASKAIKELKGRTFDGRIVGAESFDEGKFEKKDFV